MAFSVQDDNATVEDANAYITVAFFKSYHDDRGNSYGAATDPDIEKAIVKATDHVDTRFKYVGETIQREQPTQWPRQNAYDRHDDLVLGVPLAIKRACAEYALRALSSTPLMPDPTTDASGRKLKAKSEKLGPIESSVEYDSADGGAELPRYPQADRMILNTGLVRANSRTLVRA